MLFFFFFFQAEDGIRDIGVTGVQTCALPISGCSVVSARSTSPTLAPPASTSGCPPVFGRSTGGMRIVAIAETYRLAGAEELVVGELAELGVGDLGGVLATDRALGVAAHLELGEARAERL